MKVLVVFYSTYGHVYKMAAAIAGGDGCRIPSENELEAARFQGKHVAGIASKLAV